MTRPYCIESLKERLEALGIPFSAHFARALSALLTGRKISLHQVTHLMPGEQNPEANRQQLRRCLDHDSLTQEVWGKAIAALLPRDKWVLALDRTEWQRGQTRVNVLTLAVVALGCATPLLWTVLPECGASDTEERVQLMERFVALFGKERMRFVTADREFIGTDWIGWLLEQKIPFRIRIKAGEKLLHPDGRVERAALWCGQGRESEPPRRMLLWALPVYVSGKSLPGGQFLIVISNQASDLLEDYRLRWKIETLFQALKGRGFDLESCRLSKERRLSGWFGFLALALCWCLKVGQALDESAPLPLKKHGRRAVSVFHRGWSALQSLLACLTGKPCERRFDQAVDLLCAVK
jgi:hypothetical protein